MKHFILAAVVAIGITNADTAQALSPATEEQLICGASVVVMAEVMDAVPPARCEYNAASAFTDSRCAEPQYVTLSAKVKKIIGEYNENPKVMPIEDLRVGENITVQVRAFNALPREIAGVVLNHEGNGAINIKPPTGQLLTKENVVENFVGKEFIFSVTKMDKDSSKPLFSLAWRPSREQWVNATLHGENYPHCPKPAQ